MSHHRPLQSRPRLHRSGLALLSLLLVSSPVSQAAPSSPTNGSGEPPIRIGGSSTVFPIIQGAIRSFRAAGHRAPISLQETGTSEGFRRFCAGELEIANASRPINDRELKACANKRIGFIELPLAFDAISVVVHPSNTWAKEISNRELSRLWSRQAQGRIERWNQVNSSWPGLPIKLCGPGKDSGTYDYFNKAINGNSDNSRQDYSASENDSVIASCIAQNSNALGYFGFSHYKANQSRLKALAISAGTGKGAGTGATAVSPSILTVQQGRYQPLARPLFIYINDNALSSNREVQRFSTFTVRNGLRIVEQAGDIPLPSSTYQLVESKLYKRIRGSAFGGDLPIGLSIGEALRRSFDLNKLPQYR